MSGGFFNYKQYHLEEMADVLERELNIQGKEKCKEELLMDDEYYEKYPEAKFYETYPDEVQEKIKEAIKALRIARVYAQRVDWFLSGDDGEESFIKRLEQDLKEVNEKYPSQNNIDL